MEKRFDRILLTGAAGQLGRMLRKPLAAYGHTLRLSDITPAEGELAAGEEWRCCDLADPAAVADLLAGVDAVVHLGGHASEASWETIAPSNICGTYNLWEGARRAGTQRIVYASSNHITGFHRRDTVVDTCSPVRPDSLYAVSKVFGEGLARLYADKHGLTAFCIRIGSCFPEPVNRRMLSTWLSYRDLAQLVGIGLTADYHFEIVYGVSANDRRWWDNRNAARLGYAPQDNAETWRERVENIVADNDIDTAFQGGDYPAMDFTGRIDDIN